MDNDGSKCEKCGSGYRVVNGECVAETTDNSTVLSCTIEGCTNCTSPSTNNEKCTKCSGEKVASADGKSCVNCEVVHCSKCIEYDSETCETCNSGFIKENGKCVTPKVVNECKTGYYISESNTCLPCPSSCSSCLSESYCTECINGIENKDGKCEECFDKFKGCESSHCDNSRCNKCLKAFQPLIDGKCTTENQPQAPKFGLYGFGRFEYRNKRKKISFRMYFKITSGMMYDCEIEFTLTIMIGRRVLETANIKGIGKQVGVAEGDEKEVPDALDKFVIMECEAPSEGDISDYSEFSSLSNGIPENTEIKLTSDPIFYKINSVDSNTPVTISDEIKKVNIPDETGTRLETEQAMIGTEYEFQQTGDCECKYKGKTTYFKIPGKVNLNTTITGGDYYTIKTSGNNATCELYKKDVDSSDSSLNCTVNNNKTGFTIDNQNGNIEYSSTVYLSLTDTNKKLCNKETEANNPSSSGLSGGAIAGTIIACVVGVAVIGTIIFVISKGMIAKGAIAGASYTTTPELTQVSKGNLTADKLGEYSV